MNTNEKKLFEGLNLLCANNEAFYFSEQDYKEHYTIRSFTYRLASWTDFLAPYAKDSRGTAFILDKRTGEWSLFCRAYKKFHNCGEGIPKEDFIKDNKPIVSYEKLDGSLILVGSVDGELVAKSKTSINSDQAKIAQNILETNKTINDFCNEMIGNNHTPVFELIGRNNVIVLRYNVDEELVLLGVIYNNDGSYETFKTKEEVEKYQEEHYNIRIATPYNLSWDELFHIQETSKPDIEGYVVDTEKGLTKIKVRSYVDLHRLKDSIGNMKNLISIILSDDVDDLIGSFQDDQETINYIVEIQEKISHDFNHLVVEYKELRRKYFQDFRSVRKDFAIAHRNDKLFGSVMKGLKGSFRDVEEIAEKAVREYILKKCSSLTDAKNYVESL